MTQPLKTKDDVLEAALEPIVERLVAKALDAYFTVNGMDAMVGRYITEHFQKREIERKKAQAVIGAMQPSAAAKILEPGLNALFDNAYKVYKP